MSSDHDILKWSDEDKRDYEERRMRIINLRNDKIEIGKRIKIANQEIQRNKLIQENLSKRYDALTEPLYKKIDELRNNCTTYLYPQRGYSHCGCCREDKGITITMFHVPDKDELTEEDYTDLSTPIRKRIDSYKQLYDEKYQALSDYRKMKCKYDEEITDYQSLLCHIENKLEEEGKPKHKKVIVKESECDVEKKEIDYYVEKIPKREKKVYRLPKTQDIKIVRWNVDELFDVLKNK